MTTKLKWTQPNATTWRSGHWSIHFHEFNMKYAVNWSTETEAIGHAGFDELDAAKAYCEENG